MRKANKNNPPFQVDAYLSLGIPKSQILELKDAFDLLDLNLTGTIDAAQLKALVSDAKNQSLSIAVQQAAKSNKAIDFTTFLHVLTLNVYSSKENDRYRRVFRLFDDENMGCITAKNLRRVIKELGLDVDENEVQEMIDKADTNNDGVVSEEQFCQIMTRISYKI